MYIEYEDIVAINHLLVQIEENIKEISKILNKED